ncbi:MAG: hypothetical protein H7319_15280 [Spirosoma sp.]|nr:hypothetical protein [Spirosoma sp.]
MNCKNGNCESAFLEELREQRRNEIFAAIIAGAIVYKVGSWMLGNVSNAVSEHNQTTDNCSLEVDPDCDGYDCFFFICNQKSNGRIIRIEQMAEHKYKVGAGDQIEYASTSSEAEKIAEKLTQCNCN